MLVGPGDAQSGAPAMLSGIVTMGATAAYGAFNATFDAIHGVVVSCVNMNMSNFANPVLTNSTSPFDMTFVNVSHYLPPSIDSLVNETKNMVNHYLHLHFPVRLAQTAVSNAANGTLHAVQQTLKSALSSLGLDGSNLTGTNLTGTNATDPFSTDANTIDTNTTIDTNKTQSAKLLQAASELKAAATAAATITATAVNRTLVDLSAAVLSASSDAYDTSPKDLIERARSLAMSLWKQVASSWSLASVMSTAAVVAAAAVLKWHSGVAERQKATEEARMRLLIREAVRGMTANNQS
eukprot:3640025-Pyramimonas_sp.AAC.1